MANEKLAKLEELLRSDDAIQAKIQELTTSFEGDLKDDKALFEATIGKVAEELGLPVSYEEATEFAAPERALDDTELDAVAGGSGFCYVVGGSDDVEMGCQDAEAIGYMCAYVGVTAGH